MEDPRTPLIETPFYVGPWYVEPGANRITGEGRSVRIEPKVMQVLRCLAARPGRTLSRADLLEIAWAGTIVEENALSRAISQLRKVFGDDPRQPAVIETISKTGYRLIAPVVPEYRSGDSQTPGDSAPRHPEDIALGAPTFAPARATRRTRFRGVVLAVAAVAAVAWFALRGPDTPPPGTPAPFTSLIGTERQPSFSPDGRQIAFVWIDEDGQTDLYTKLIGADTPLRLTDHPGEEWSPVWSPDGTQIAFVRYDDDACGVYTVPALGGPPTQVAPCEGRFFMEFSWSPDGRTMVLSWRGLPGEPYRLVLLDVATGARRPLTDPPADYLGDVDPTFSPDGRTVAFARTRTETIADLYRVPVEGGEPERLTHDGRFLAGFNWTPDGRMLTVSSNRSGVFSLWNVPANGGPPVPVTGFTPYDPGNPVYAPDGRRMAYVEWYFDFNIWRMTPGTPDARRVIASTRWEQYPQLSPDGADAVFVSNRSGSTELWRSRADGSRPVRLTDFGDAYVGPARWSPDGQRLVFEVRRGVRSDVYLLPAGGGTPEPFITSEADDRNPTWSHDGRAVYFASNRSGEEQIWTAALDGGPARQVTRIGGNLAFEAPDGRSLYFTRPLHDGLWQQPLDGGEAVQRLTVPAAADWGNWVVQPEGIYFIIRDTPARLARYDEASGQAIPLYTPPGRVPTAQVALSVAAGQVLVTLLDHRDTDIMLVDR